MKADQTTQLTRMVALVGMMGSGKTAVGRALADLLSVPFMDTDAEIERAAQSSISEVFARDGEAFFRGRETAVLERLMSGPAGILSTGGGAWMQPRNRDIICENGVAVWLDVDLDLLWDRVRRKDTRPLLRTDNPRATLARIFDERRDVYALAPLRVAAQPDLSVAQMAHKLHEALRDVPQIWEQRDA